MMPKYIDTDNILQGRFTSPQESEYARGWNDGLEAVTENAPSADVAPVVHGKWETGNPICPICGENKFKGLDADIWADWNPPFCPNCGADMRGEPT